MRKKICILLVFIGLMACDLDGPLLPTKNEIIKAAERAGATNVDVISYIYAKEIWDHPTINTDGGDRRTKGNYITNIEVRVIYTASQGSSLSNTDVVNAIKQLFIDNNFSSDEVTVFANPRNLSQLPEDTETYPLPTYQSITEAVQNFGATSITIAAYTVNGNTVNTSGTMARSNAPIIIRVNYSYNGLGTVIPSQSAVILAIRDLFTDFTNVTASVSPAAMFPLPAHSSVIALAMEQNANNVRIIEYKAGNEDIGEFYYGSIQSNILIKISITYDVGANVTLVEQAVRGLFQHFTDVAISTMLAPPTREQIISELNKEGAASVNIITYTIAGSNASAGLRAINVAILLNVNYTTEDTSSNGPTAVRNLFQGFTNANIYVGNNIPITLPTQAQIKNAIFGNNYDISTADINTFTVNGINANTLSFASSSDNIIIRVRASTWIFTGFTTGINWGQGYYQVIGNNSIEANNARGRVKQLFIDTGFSHSNNISIIFE